MPTYGHPARYPRTTRAHFALIAGAIHSARELVGDSPSDQAVIDTVSRRMADTLRAANSGFKRDLFLVACGVSEDSYNPVGAPAPMFKSVRG